MEKPVEDRWVSIDVEDPDRDRNAQKPKNPKQQFAGRANREPKKRIHSNPANQAQDNQKFAPDSQYEPPAPNNRGAHEKFNQEGPRKNKGYQGQKIGRDGDSRNNRNSPDTAARPQNNYYDGPNTDPKYRGQGYNNNNTKQNAREQEHDTNLYQDSWERNQGPPSPDRDDYGRGTYGKVQNAPKGRNHGDRTQSGYHADQPHGSNGNDNNYGNPQNHYNANSRHHEDNKNRNDEDNNGRW
jgi:hypothetical protein